MARLGDLHDEILCTIFLLLVASGDGPMALASLSATCKKLRYIARQPIILKAVNFERISFDDFEKHHHRNDLLCQSARFGNPDAMARLGKPLLLNDKFFWNMLVTSVEPLILRKRSSIPCHEKLVRSYICLASYDDLALMQRPLVSYVLLLLGYDMASACGIMLDISAMCYCYMDKLKYTRKGKELEEDDASVDGVRSFAELVRMSGDRYRRQLLAKFDKMFRKGRE